MTGTLIICGTPIGNLGDAAPRLAATLGGADVILAEDTRRARLLMNHLDVTGSVKSYFAGNEARRARYLEAHLRQGATVVLITDAGMPTVSDPGVSAVRVAQSVGATISVVPGPSAALAALAGSGLPSERFVFEGFLPRKGVDRSARLGELAAESRTIVMFSATNRVVEDLEALAAALGMDRQVSVSRELTKLHEEFWTGTLEGAVAEWSNRTPRGEFTLVVAGRISRRPAITEAVEDVVRRIDSGQPMSDAVRVVAESLSVGRRALYQAVLDVRPQD